jgi:DNA-binding MarR family transcriptional regulator
MQPLIDLFDEVRLLNHRLVQVADRLHADGDVSTPGRAVLEYLHNNGPSSVPTIARARYVTRQHIQAIVDGLATAELVEPMVNPAHRTSPLIALTEAGRDVFARMQSRERQLIEQLAERLDGEPIERATILLATIRAAIDDKESPR